MKKLIVSFFFFITFFTFPHQTNGLALANPILHDPNYSVELVASGLGAVTGVKLDSEGNIFLTDYLWGRILKIHKDTYAVETYASGFTNPTDLTFDSSGNLYVTSLTGGLKAILQVFPDGSKSVFSSGFANSIGLETGSDDYLFIGNSGDGTISIIDSTGISETFLSGFGGPHGPFGLAFDEEQNLYFVQHGTGQIHKSTPDMTVTTLANLTDFGPTYIRVGPSTNLYVSDSLNAKIFKIFGSDVTVFASDFTGKSSPPVIGPSGLFFNDSGDLFVGDGAYLWKFTKKTHLQKIQEILVFFDESVADDTLTGYGPGNSADGKLNALMNMLETAADLISVNDMGGACTQLESALGKCDGVSRPPDFVIGQAASELHDMILELIEALGCQ